jgi:predicted DCC family thiol-disulfide oxidoreductase YuxK
MSASATGPVLLYDGECALCQRIVRLLLRTDRAARLRFAPLQSPPAQEYLRTRGLPVQDFDSLVFVPQWGLSGGAGPLFRTDGLLAAAAAVGGIWRAVTWLRVLPVGPRDAAYRLVARLRHVLFGRHRPSPQPDPAWEHRFLGR